MNLALQESRRTATRVTIAGRQVELAQIGSRKPECRGQTHCWERRQAGATGRGQAQSAVSDAQIIAPIDGQVHCVYPLEGTAVDAFKYVATVSISPRWRPAQRQSTFPWTR